MSLIADRYASSQMRQIWSRESKVLKERELWITVMKAQAKLGLNISKDVLEDYERVKSKIDLSSIDRREAELKHDVKARIEEFNFLAGHQSIHVGLTSRDVTENIEGWQIKQSLHLTLASSNLLLQELIEKIEKYADLPIVGRTHNVPAQLTTLGRRFASWSEEFLFALEGLENLESRFPLKGINGAIGTGSDLKSVIGSNWQSIEDSVLESLSVNKSLIAPSQIYPRSIDFQVISSLFQLASPLASIATNIRLMAGLGLVAEGKASNQVGSSAMPHKNNPRLSERVNALFIVLKGYLTMASEISGNQWNEGDVSESVVRRIALLDAFYCIDAILRTMTKVVKELEISKDNIAREVDLELEYLLSSKVLLLAFEKGVGRESAHKAILDCADKSRSPNSESFFTLISKTSELKVSESELLEIKSALDNHLGDAPLQARAVLNLAMAQISGLPEAINLNLDEISN
jgi:adenylosuccinate lyase